MKAITVMMRPTLRALSGLTLILLIEAAPHARAQDAGAWAADVDTLIASIRRIHPNPHRVFRPSAFDSVAAAVKARLPSLSPHAAALETQRLLAMVGDGHTEWGTVGVSGNLIEASWQALVDSMECKLLRE